MNTLAYRKEVWIGWISSLAEAYNMAIYYFIAPLIAPLLFQQTSDWNALFFSYSLVFIGSCILYPAGAIYYGFLGDRYGRQKICIYSTLGLAIATGLMGLVPLNLVKEGWIYFLLLIGAQNFFSGGEYHGSTVFSLEHSNKNQNGFTSSLSCLFAVVGIALANGLATLASQGKLSIQICFLVGAVGGIISFTLKTYCKETPDFCSIDQESLKRTNWIIFLQEQWKIIGSVVVTIAFFIVSYSFIFLFLPLIHTQTTEHEFSTFKSLIAYGFFLVLSGMIADKMGIQKTILIGLCLFSLVIIPAILILKNLFILQIVLTPFACLVIGPIHSWMLQEFIISQRCRGIFVSSAIATSIFGGSTVPICLLIFEKSHSLALCGLYPLLIALISIGTLIFAKQPKALVA